jgi:pimeloyl-ACP methyl ester carboxylesterase
MPTSSTTDTAALIPDARVEVVEEAGHFPWLERPGEIRRIVATFLDEHPAPSIPDRLLDPDFIPEP